MGEEFHREIIDIIYTVMLNNTATIQGASPLGWSVVYKMVGGEPVKGIRYLRGQADLDEADAILADESLNVLIL